MMTEDQSEVVAFLSDPATYGETSEVEVIETHISRVFLVGDSAFKMKRALKLPYVDFSNAKLRKSACEKEVLFNMPGAPGLYVGVREIRRSPSGKLCFNGEGVLVDAIVEMVRFDQSLLADRMALEGRLTPALMTEIAQMIARFHEAAPVVHAEGGAANIAGVLSINEAGFATSHVFESEEVRTLSLKFRDRLAAHAARLDRREVAGKVRRCHGDLHLRNICIPDGEPRLFDSIEFNDQIATVDTLYDLAFLLMDLWHRGFRQFANLVANRYLDQTDNEDGFVLLPFFMAVRAAVRAHVLATQVEESSGDPGPPVREARSYFELANTLLTEGEPALVAIGGLSGSGKTTVADALAPLIGPPPGARIIESDRIRKAVHGVGAETRLPASAYRPEISEQVYRELARRAGNIIDDGGTVVADAVFDKPANREMVESVAHIHKATFAGIWLETQPDVLRQRVASRKAGQSDADLAVLNLQLAKRPEAITWEKLDAAQSVAALIDQILKQRSSKAINPSRPSGRTNSPPPGRT
jgi:aminoglycoside phosphotransferase family enzyme/predicted kinase